MKAKAKLVRSERRAGTRKALSLRMQPKTEYLFVYGTLKRGGKSHGQLVRKRGVRFVGAARIRGELYKLDGESFPGAIQTAAGDSFVKGHLFALRDPEETLASLDEFEGVSEGLFRRELVNAWIRRRRMKAWAYFYARPLMGASLVPTGMYSSR